MIRGALRVSVAVSLSVLALLACNRGLEPEAQSGSCPPGWVGACGTIVFRGAIPESTQVVYVVAYANFPESESDLLTFTPLAPPTLDLPGSPSDTITTYRLELAPGRYEWILAVWKKIGVLSLQNADSLLREAGFYRDPANASLPGVVNVTGSEDSIDFVVDFDNMHPVSFYFPPQVRR